MQVWNSRYVDTNGSAVARVDASIGTTAKLLSSDTVTTTVNVGPFFMEDANAIWLYWEIDGISGAGASLNIVAQASATQAGTYNQFLTTGAKTATGNGIMCTVMPLTSGSPQQWFRINLTVAGTSPSIQYAIYAVPFYIGPNA